MLDFCSHDKYYIVSDRVADACGACNLGRNLRGSPHFFLYRDKGDKMGKIFLTYEEQLNKLINEKHLIVKDVDYAKEMLMCYSYYSLIGGYKEKFKNPSTALYVNAKFEDIVALYEFDEQLREILLKYLLKTEGQVKSHLSYYFCEKYGEQQEEYLKPQNYNQEPKNAGDIAKLVKILRRLTEGNTDYHYINHAIRKHKNVPLWVLTNALTFGNISKMYMLSQYDIQSKVAKNYPGVNEDQLVKFLSILTHFRNVCAHGERLYTYRTKKAIPNMPLHEKLKIGKSGQEYANGKHDLFAAVIAMRYLLPGKWFLEFKKELIKVINGYLRKSTYFTEEQLWGFMGFPNNWKSITRFRK